MEDNTELLVDILVDYCCECETEIEVIEKLARLMVEVVEWWGYQRENYRCPSGNDWSEN